jgi:hypothetical protein
MTKLSNLSLSRPDVDFQTTRRNSSDEKSGQRSPKPQLGPGNEPGDKCPQTLVANTDTHAGK